MANGSRKRLFEPNCEEFSEIKSPTKYAKIHGVVSPMQSGASGCKYFHGSLTDGNKSLRVVVQNSNRN